MDDVAIQIMADILRGGGGGGSRDGGPDGLVVMRPRNLLQGPGNHYPFSVCLIMEFT
jgi:hypothetical protein